MGTCMVSSHDSAPNHPASGNGATALSCHAERQGRAVPEPGRWTALHIMRRYTIVAVIGLLACLGPKAGAATNEVKTAELKKVLALFGKVAEAKYPIIGEDGGVDSHLMALGWGADGGKLGALLHEELYTGTITNSFVGLPEVAQHIDGWPVRPQYLDLYPETAVPIADVRKYLGQEHATNQLSFSAEGSILRLGAAPIVKPAAEPGISITPVWHRYGRWAFGSTGGSVVIVRAIFTDARKDGKVRTVKGSVQQNVMFPPDAAPPMGALTTDFLFARSP